MSPRRRDPGIRARLLAAAARLLAEEGPAALTVRRLSAETGTSTMAIYTYFGSMEELRRAVRRDGFERLEVRLDAVVTTGDPVADVVGAGEVYFDFALSDPHLYRAMFVDRPLEDDDDVGQPTFERIVAAVLSGIRADRFRPEDSSLATVWAAQLWSMRHGMVTMTLTGALTPEQARFVLSDMMYRLLVGYGDSPAAARASIERASGRSDPSTEVAP
jgi:AcrR family transcriptional regulator